VLKLKKKNWKTNKQARRRRRRDPDTEGVKGKRSGGKCVPPQPTRGPGERRELPSCVWDAALAETDLFHSITKYGHCLHELLSCYAERPDSLRPRGHDHVLPVCSKKLHKQSFLVRSLFDCV